MRFFHKLSHGVAAVCQRGVHVIQNSMAQISAEEDIETRRNNRLCKGEEASLWCWRHRGIW